MADSGFLVMADITGFTSYLNESELEHAQQSLATILEVIAESTEAPLVVSRIVGDAVVSYGFDRSIKNTQILVDEIENSYLVYRRALGQMVLNTTCDCNACANIESLDLKFLVHHGEFSVQPIAGGEELIGPQVNKLFRLAKNDLKETLGIEAYIAFTEQAIEALALDGFESALVEYTQEVADFGSVRLGVMDMHRVWEQRKDDNPLELAGRDVMMTFTRVIRAGVGVVWDHVTDPVSRSRLFVSESGGVSRGEDGRMGVGGTYVCAHGNYRVPHRIVEWIPLSQYTFLSENPHFRHLWQVRLNDLGDSTRLDLVVGRLEAVSPMKNLAKPFYRRYTNRATNQGLDEFVSLVEAAVS